MKKSAGTILVVVGLLLVVISYPTVQTALSIKMPASLTSNLLFYLGAAITVIGAFVAFGPKSSKKMSEVPIYHGKEVVGYRRMHK